MHVPGPLKKNCPRNWLLATTVFPMRLKRWKTCNNLFLNRLATERFFVHSGSDLPVYFLLWGSHIGAHGSANRSPIKVVGQFFAKNLSCNKKAILVREASLLRTDDISLNPNRNKYYTTS